MEFDKLKTEVKKVELDMTRIDDNNYFEVVVKKGCLESVVKILEGIFGPPAWPSRSKLSKETQGALKNFGGLRDGQTLYFLTREGHSIFAMLWPWQDGERTTLKMGRVS